MAANRTEKIGDCGCVLTRTEHGLHMEDCPMHAAAPEMLAACIWARDALTRPIDAASLQVGLGALNAVIAKAGGCGQ
jgi:hypothetical protein